MYRFLLLMLSTAAAAVSQLANQPLLPLQADAHSCGAACYAFYNQSAPAEGALFGAQFDYDFYATAKNFTGSKPGDLLKLEPINPKQLASDPGTTVYRMQYTSKDIDGSPVPVTGFIAFPFSLPKNQSKFRLMAWAHGTSGIFPGCVPSNGPSLYGGLYPAVAYGYAVVGTDYAGLGNNYTTHKYLSYPAHASDVYYSTIAARKAFGNLLSKEWVSFGHSQGGAAVWSLAESKYVQDKKEAYLGTVALAPATRVVDMMLKNSTYKFNGITGFIPESLHRYDPSYNSTILTDEMEQRVQLQKQIGACVVAASVMVADLSNDEFISPQKVKQQLHLYEKWQNAVSPAMGAKSSSPVWVAQGLKDSSIIPYTTENAWKKSCDSGNEVHLQFYPGMEHVPVLAASTPDWMAWVGELFDKAGDKSKKSECSKEVKKPFDIHNVQLGG